MLLKDKSEKNDAALVRRALAIFAAALRWRRPVGRQAEATLLELRQAADPDALGGWFAEVDARGAVAGDGEGHGFVVFALMDAEAGAGPAG